MNIAKTQQKGILFMTKQEFDLFFQENYTDVVYEDVKTLYETYYNEQEGKLFHDDYQSIDENTFIENLSDDAKFQFQDILLEVFYDKNPSIYESAFEIFELNQGQKSDVTKSFDDCYQQLYTNFLNQLALDHHLFA